MTAEKKNRPVAPDRPKAGNKSVSQDADTQVAAALRSAYEEAVREDVPAEFLDLLGKLS